MEPATLILRSPAPVEAAIGQEVVLMSIDRGECVGLGATGSEVWRLLAEPTPLGILTARLRELYEAPEGELERDLADLLYQMRTLSLVNFQ